MRNRTYPVDSCGTLVLPASGTRAYIFQFSLVTAAVILPAAAHLCGAPVRWLLPMHWPVILAALVYGWRGGMTVGMMAPFTSYLLTGLPLLVKALPMTFELAVYGLVIGYLREKRGWNSFGAVAMGLIAGRIVFLGMILLTGANEVVFGQYLLAAMAPGIVAAVGMVVMLPLVAKRLVSV